MTVNTFWIRWNRNTEHKSQNKHKDSQGSLLPCAPAMTLTDSLAQVVPSFLLMMMVQEVQVSLGHFLKLFNFF